MKLSLFGTIQFTQARKLGRNDLKLVFLVEYYLCKNIVYIKEIHLDLCFSLEFPRFHATKALVIFWSEFCTSGISVELQAKSHESHNSYQKLPLILYFFILRLSIGSIVYRKQSFSCHFALMSTGVNIYLLNYRSTRNKNFLKEEVLNKCVLFVSQQKNSY